jgi:hypothetical protein
MFLTKENSGGSFLVNTLETIRYVKREGILGKKPLAKRDKDYTVASRAGGQNRFPNHLWGMMVIAFRVSIRSCSGGWVLKSDDNTSVPKSGFTMQRADVEGETAVVGMR